VRFVPPVRDEPVEAPTPDEAGQVVARVGEKVRMGGGTITYPPIWESTCFGTCLPVVQDLTGL